MNHAKIKCLLPVIILLVCLAIPTVITGCGGVSARAKEILNNSNKSMEAIKTTRMHFDMDTKAMGESLSITMVLDQVVDSPEGMKLRAVMEIKGQEMEMYMVGGMSYIYAEGEWYKTSEPLTKRLTAGFGSIEELQEAMPYAEEAKVIKEDKDSYKIFFRLGNKYFKKKIQESEEQGSATIYIENLGSYDSIIGDCTYTISKKTNYVTAADFALSLNSWQSGNSKTKGETTLEYNLPIDIQLPPEALNAPTMPNSETP